ncbi:uncharacterized protein LOC130012494 isoform X2 [Patella vulgata]|uniref:uncharacterized protein LOC130012494 isoform X2 n=1 Tax=Patella vulgata TaxID=6465 RepID=UPI0024A9F00F|nr:uncharacterized protein LOC130012494 isoform X2 [Patella vulgata]
MATSLMFIIGLLMDLTSVIEGVLVYACYKPPGSVCSNHNLTCSNGDLIGIFHLYYATKPSNITCPLIQDEDDCKTSVCCTRGSGDTTVGFNQQERLTVYKKCSYKESCSLNYPYNPTTGYDYIWYHYGCFSGYSDNYIINTTTFTTTGSRYLIFSGKSTPTRDLTCSCNITGRLHFATEYIFLTAESCNSVTITVDNQSLYWCTGDDVVLLPSNIKYDKISIQFNRYTSNTNDVIWLYYYHTASQYLLVSGDCGNRVLVDGGWSAWSITPCSATCGQGTRRRFRYCNNPAPANNGKNCIGDIMDSETCAAQSCSALYETTRVNGGWGTWSNTSCSVTCGVGIRTRFRHCDNPYPANGGTDCNGELSEDTDCNLEECHGL